jgi:dihydroneopterin aldolase
MVETMDKIIISDLEVYAYHGVASEEKSLGQMFFISLEIFADLETAAITGNLETSVSYAEVCQRVQAVVQKESFDLIETVAYRVIREIFNTFKNAQEVKVQIKKPWAPMGQHLKYAAVEMQRSRGDYHEA